MACEYSPALAVLERVHAHITLSHKWAEPVGVSYRAMPLYKQVASHIASLGGAPLVKFQDTETCIDMFDIVDAVLSALPDDQSVNLTMVLTEHGAQRIGVALIFDKEFIVSSDVMRNVVNRAVGKIVALVSDDVDPVVFLEMLTGSTRLLFSIDGEMDKMSCRQEVFAAEAPMICFLCQSDFVEKFQEFAIKVYVYLCFRRQIGFSCGFGRECLLVNIPVGVERVLALSKLMFRTGITHRVEETCDCEGIDGVSECYMLCNVSAQKEGTLSFFLYTNGRPTDHPKLQHNILSAVKWSDYNMSLLPSSTAESAFDWPFSITCKTIDERGFSYVILVNSSFQESIALAVKSIEGCLSKLTKKIPTIRIRTTNAIQRLDGVWRNLDQIASSLSSMVPNTDTGKIWTNAAHMITQYHSHKQKQNRPQTMSQFVDNRRKMLEL